MKRTPKAKIPELMKEVTTKHCNTLVETLKMQHVQPPPEGIDTSYITDIYLKWFRGNLYFCAQYCCRAKNCIEPSFEIKFARMEYAGNRCFNLSFMRHTGQWVELYPGLPLEECLEAIRTEPYFLA